MDSPRGRIQLMETNLDGTLSLNPTVTQHFDRCLGCMACVTACPSGVALRPAHRGDARDGRDGDRRARSATGSCAARCSSSSPTRAAWAPPCASRRSAASAPAARTPRGDDGDRAALALDGEARRDDAGAWRDARACRDPDRLRAVGRVRLGQRGDRARPRGGRLRGRGAATGLLRRPVDARRPRRRGPGVRAAADRGVRRRRDRDRQHLRLRLAPEGARTRPRGRSRLGRARGGVLDPRPRPRRVPRGSRAARAAAPTQPEGGDAGLVPPPPRADSCRSRRPPPYAAIPGLTLVEPAEQDICCGSAGHLQRHPACRRTRARRPQGGERARDRGSGLREREPRLPRPGRDRAPAGRGADARAAPDRDRRRLDQEPRRGGPACVRPAASAARRFEIQSPSTIATSATRASVPIAIAARHIIRPGRRSVPPNRAGSHLRRGSAAAPSRRRPP